VDLDQKQRSLAGEEFSRGCGDLRRGGKMNVTVTRVIGAAAVDALPLGLTPGRSRADFVDGGHLMLLVEFRFRGNPPTVSAASAELKGTRRPGQAKRAPGPITTGSNCGNAGATGHPNHDGLWLWVPAFAGTTASLRHVIRLLAVEDALERIEMPLRRWRIVAGLAAIGFLGPLDHGIGHFL